MEQKTNHLWTSFKEWSVRVPKGWWDTISVLSSAIPFIASIIAFFVWGSGTKPPLSIWIRLSVGIGALLFIIFSFLAFDKARTMAEKPKSEFMASREKEQNKRLRIHFNEMQKISSDIISTLKVDDGRIYLPNSSLDNLQKFPLEYRIHFPQEDNAWDTYCAKIKEHNEKYEELLKKIKESFTSAEFRWINNTSHPESPGISWRIYDPLFIWWNDRYNHSANLTVDFEKIDSDIAYLGQVTTDANHLWVFGYGAAWIAYYDNESDKGKCKKVIADVAFNNLYEKESANLISSANDLLKSVSELKSQLSNKIQDVDKYWPGTTDYKFTRLEQCPTCKKIIQEIDPPPSHKGGPES